MKKLQEFLTWPVAFVLVSGAAIFTLLVMWGPPDAKEYMLGANGLLWTLLGIYGVRRPQDEALIKRLSIRPPPPVSQDEIPTQP